ncbi:DUF1798 family protein [Bacillus sp. B-jedd]|uniref:DUF1798 family protein n=1 Tax=Bacillus sp. B-jedd TaxID=1476857 RepID=UPI0005156536|nr:DUF1798 family protein [Bacillus sp. B-jedd]CEG27615.1 hypothetical protein BN1002_02485 [Bacillus sp. B-jedd]
MEDLRTLTLKLLDYNRQCVSIFENARKKGTDGDFYMEVKPFADEVTAINNKWKEIAMEHSAILSQEGITTKQIEMVNEHLERLAIQAFYIKTSRYTFMNSSRTVEYTLQKILEKVS